MKVCKTHGDYEGIRCNVCRSEHVKNYRRRRKQKLIELFGGKCCLCGYDKCVAALHFHHLNPKEKSFGIASRGLTHSWEKLKKEARKCVLLCSNCHAEVESGVVKLASHLVVTQAL